VKPAFHLSVGCRVCSAIALMRASAASARTKSPSSIAMCVWRSAAKVFDAQIRHLHNQRHQLSNVLSAFASVSGAQHA